MFKKELELICSDEIRKMVELTLEKVPEYFYTIPASTTGKYHPAYSLGVGGLYRHTQAAVKIADDITKLHCMYFNGILHDCVIAALILHDTMKCGNPEEKYTRHDHPMLAANLFYTTVDGKFSDTFDDTIRIITDAIASHMGQWNTSKHSEVVLPVPEDAFNVQVANMVHLCDYLASRRYLTVDLND